MPQEKIDNIRCTTEEVVSGKGPWTDRDRILLRLVDEQLATYSNEETTVHDALEILSNEELVEVIIVIGVYVLLARLMKGLRIDDDAEIPDLKEKLRGKLLQRDKGGIISDELSSWLHVG